MIIEKVCDATSNKLFEVRELTGNNRGDHRCCVGHTRTFSAGVDILHEGCLLYTSPSPRDRG